MQRVLVTGGAGFIGSHVTEELVRRGYQVRILDNFFRGSHKNLEGFETDLEIIEGDCADLDTMKRALAGMDTVYHLASVNGTKYFYTMPDKILNSGIRGMLNLIEALAGANVERVIYASTAEAYGIPQQFPTPEDHPLVVPDPRNPRWSYSGTKIIGELLLLNNAAKLGIAPVIIRYHNSYGPRMGWKHVVSEFLYRMITGARFTISGTGEETRSFCYISDTVEGSLLAGTQSAAAGEIFNLGNPHEITINQLVSALEEVTGIFVQRHYVPFPQSGTPRRVPDISKAERLLGYMPQVGLYEGLSRTYEWAREALSEGQEELLR
jgi:nucleoside-diphosphate-sugar epimerase